MKTSHCYLIGAVLVLTVYVLIGRTWGSYSIEAAKTIEPWMSMISTIGFHVVFILLLVHILRQLPVFIERELTETNRRKITQADYAVFKDAQTRIKQLEGELDSLKNTVYGLAPSDDERKRNVREFFKDAVKACSSITVIHDKDNKSETKTTMPPDSEKVKALVEAYSKLF